MTREEINKLAAKYLGLCWHEFKIKIPIFSVPTCIHCGLKISRAHLQVYRHTDFCSDHHAVTVLIRSIPPKLRKDLGLYFWSAVDPQPNSRFSYGHVALQSFLLNPMVATILVLKAVGELPNNYEYDLPSYMVDWDD